MHITLTQVNRYTTSKDGSPLKTKDGRPYTSVRVKCVEYGDKILSGFENHVTKSWKEGDKVEVEVEEKGDYLNFRTPKKEGVSDAKLEQVLNYLAALRVDVTKILGIIEAQRKANDMLDTPEDDFQEPTF